MEQKKETRKRTWRRGTQERTRQSKPGTLRESGGKTVWDWLHLLSVLAIPVVLTVVGFWFTAQQDARQQRIEDQRAEAERELAEQRAQDEALEGYLDQMSGLLLEKDLRAAEADSEVRTLARARTLTVLERLDPSHKNVVIQFLMEADLVQRVEGSQPVISLVGADLSGTNLSLYDLRGVDWSGIDLSGASLWGTNLSDADLTFADLRGATLGGYLNNANLLQADLRGVKLRDPDLSGADLTLAQGVSNEELEQQAASLEGAIMPNGQTYEDWVKSKGRGKDRENSGPS